MTPLRRLVPILSLAAAIVVAPLVAPGAVAADGVAWDLVTADNANGTDRPNYEFAVDPGQTVEDAVEIVNTGTEPLALSVYAADAFTTTTGNLDLRLAGEASTDSGTWVEVDRTAVDLQPGERTEVAFRITVPADARPGDHPAGIVTSLRTQESGSALSVDRRLAIRIHLRVSGELTPAVQVENVGASFSGSWNPFEPGTLTIAYDLHNTGNTRIAATDVLDASGPFGAGRLPAAPESSPEVLPGSTVRIERTVEGVPAVGWISGALLVSPSAVGYGAAAMDAISVGLFAPAVPWALLGVLLVILVALALIVIVSRRRSRSGGEPPAP